MKYRLLTIAGILLIFLGLLVTFLYEWAQRYTFILALFIAAGVSLILLGLLFRIEAKQRREGEL